MTIELSVLNISDSNRHVLQTVCMLNFDYILETKKKKESENDFNLVLQCVLACK